VDTSNSGLPADRDASGRFLPGRSGNPWGKKPGTRNRATEIRAMLAEGEGTAVARTVIDKAKSGDAVAARFLLGLLCPRPRPRGRAIALALPDGTRAGDTVAAFNATLQAMAAGEITPDEALTVTRMLDGRLEALNAFKLQRELTRYQGDFIRGDELFRPAAERFRAPGEVAAAAQAVEDEAEEDEAEEVAAPCAPDTQTEPSPCGAFDKSSGGEDEGVCRASVVEDETAPCSPHPNAHPPELLSKGPQGEEIAASAPGPIPSVSESPPEDLHSACIELDLQAESAARRAAQRKLAQWGHLIVTQPGFSEEAFIAAEIQRSDALRRSSAALPGHNSRSPRALNGVSTVLR
jgi:hypothetical protein